MANVPFLSSLRRRSGWLEDVAVLAIATAATIYAEYENLAEDFKYPFDFKIHTYWMRRFQDPTLFRDPLTEAMVQTGYVPPGIRFLYWLASHVVDPVTLGEWLPVVLVPFSMWLLFRIVRIHTDWKPAAWIAVGLFLLPWEIHRFSGGHARAFTHPVVLLTVLLAVRKRDVAAAAVPPVGMLLYPSAGVLALATFAFSSFGWSNGPKIDLRRSMLVAVSAALVAAAALTPGLITGRQPQLITRAEAMHYPEFSGKGQMRFFTPSVKKLLRDNYSGFRLRYSGTILVVATLFFLLMRPRNAARLRREVWGMLAASLALFGLAHALLFRLYLPHRYTYPLLAFFAAFIGVSSRPTWETLMNRRHAWLLWVPAVVLVPLAIGVIALTLFPIGPQLSLAEAIAALVQSRPYLATAFGLGLLTVVLWRLLSSRRPGVQNPGAAGVVAILVGALLVGEVAWAGGLRASSSGCLNPPLYRYLETVPKDAVIAGDPMRISCVPLASRRAVVISTRLYQPWDVEYFRVTRSRMFAMVRAYYGGSIKRLIDLRTRYGADYLVVREDDLTRDRILRAWRQHQPFTGLIRQFLRSSQRAAALDLPRRCRTWQSRIERVFDLRCVAAVT
jgi:hypothetical protein